MFAPFFPEGREWYPLEQPGPRSRRRGAEWHLGLCPTQGDDKVFRRAPSWRKRFRPRDIPGGVLSVPTLGSLQPPAAPPKKVAPEGE